jgi:hypothetical protein
MMKNNMLPLAACVGMALALASCQGTDREKPTVCTGLGATYSVTAAEIDVLADSHIDLADVFCDNEGLSQVRYDIHNGAGHAHEASGEDDHGLVLHSGTEWSVYELIDVSGTEASTDLHVEVPNTARGVWHFIVNVLDEAGNVSTYNTDIHVENTYMPEFTLTSVGGEDPNMWHGEPTWSAGSPVVVSGSVTDGDGIASAELSLVDEATELPVWGPVSLTEFDAFTDTVEVPANVSGEFHFEMTATCNAGVSMETGFHVEVE